MYVPGNPILRVCEESTCNRRFETRHKTQRFCCKKCGDRSRNRTRRRKLGAKLWEEYQDERAEFSQRKKREIVENVKLQSTCKDCGLKDHVVFEFDHVRGKKVANISRMVRKSYSVQQLEDELTKCEVVCANCHRRRHAK